ncbi:MAG: hypothetical protein QOE70_1645 [Chthoniobacter sp.]|jgi:hypothetical protein|nr:hypothetical protein [Chthoniobacter sp.]
MRALQEFKPATHVVEELLRVDRFIEENKQIILERLQENYSGVTAQKQAYAMFITGSLPLVSGIIHVGSTADDFARAAAWVRDKSPKADPINVLCHFVLIYLVELGWREVLESNEPKRRTMWTRIRKAVQEPPVLP